VSLLDDQIRRFETRQAQVGVVGLGYVGLPIALAFAEAGFDVVAVDVSPERVRAVEEGRSFLHHIPDARVAEAVDGEKLRASDSYLALKNADAILICVPTPLTEGVPDLSNVIAAGSAVAGVLKTGGLVILESTTYPGTTEDLLQPLLEHDERRGGKDFFLAFSPERIDPGNSTYDFADLPKIVGGIEEMSSRAASSLYEQVVPKVVQVSGPREAELAKLIENTFRHVNIALINELAVYAHELGIDIWEAIEAAATKPFGFLPFWPGPGWGGHCIPLDPAYLSWKVRQERAHEVRFVELAHAVNSEMPRYVAERAALLLNESGKAVKGAEILGIGVAYKGGTEDTRGSGSLKVLSLLASRGASVSYHDPLVASAQIGDATVGSIDLSSQALVAADLVIVFVPQSHIDWDLVARQSQKVLDCCNALSGKSDTVRRL